MKSSMSRKGGGMSIESIIRNIRRALFACWWPIPALVAIFLLTGMSAGSPALAVYGLSFWHYAVYALAFVLRAVPVATFTYDAFWLKGIALAVAGVVFFPNDPGAVTLLVIIAGLGLNISAALRLGSERTYYGFELGSVPPKRITAFPYSLTAHPMLIGNMIAFGGTLLDSEFRALWWPLAVIHVALNGATLWMEVHGRKLPVPLAARWFAGVVGLSVIVLVAAFADQLLAIIAGTVAIIVFAALLFRRYAGGARSGGNP
ncbi:MAG: methyltransferase [Geminicoccaceae bacterium]